MSYLHHPSFQSQMEEHSGKNKKKELFQENSQHNNTQIFSPCPYCKKTNHPQQRCWWRPDVKCDNCGKLGHLKHVCKSHEQQEEANIVEDQQEEGEEELLSMSCFMTKKPSKAWIIDSGCTNHMTYDRELFKELNKTNISKVQMGNGAHLAVKGKGTLAIKSHSGFKLISDVLYVPDINQNLLSVSQLLGKGYKVLFEDKNCVIKDIHNKEVFNVHMKGKSFALNLEKEEPIINEDTSEEHKDACLQKKFDDQEENEDDEKSPSKEKFETNVKVVPLKKNYNKNHKKKKPIKKRKGRF
uniref:Retrovirus-related Pol polyprotein from transposon TNT 1-94 n=1 Tax=Cajanus cajan TaxID=3821 RepID=A0A151RTI7_CAJCA|nr:Retrovirus-related Pol polyprotein from transposon TNT 1-94 [Cajanus cajan]